MFKHIISHLTIYLVTYIFLLLLFFGVHFTIPRHDFQRAEIIPFTPKIPFSQQLFCRQKKRIVFSLTDNLKRFPLALFESPPEDDAAHGPVEAHRKSDSHNAHVHPDCKITEKIRRTPMVVKREIPIVNFTSPVARRPLPSGPA